MKQKTIIKFIIFLFLLTLTFFIIKNYNLTSHITTNNLKEIIESTGILGPLTFILLYILTTIFFLPGAIFSIASGAIFGIIKGTIYTVIGASTGAILAFIISRYFARSFFQELTQKKYKKIKEFDRKLGEKGFITTLFLRLIPLFPFNGLNFVLGITKVKIKDFYLATLIGIIPGSFLFAYLGDSIIEMNLLNIIISIALIILLALTLNIYKRKREYQKEI